MRTRVTQFLRTCAAVMLCVVLVGCSNVEDVYTGLTLKDANEMLALLRQNGIEAERLSEGAGATAAFKVSVPKEKFAESVILLSKNGYPRETFKSMAEMFPGEGLVVSPMEQRARYAYAISQELSRTISGIDGVVKARVHVVMADPEARIGQPSKASASISVHVRANIDVNDLTPKIRLIVSNAVQGLSYNDVSLSFFTLGGQDNLASTAVTSPEMQPTPNAPNSMPQQTQPTPAPVTSNAGEAEPRRLISEEPAVEPIVETPEASSWNFNSVFRYIAALLAIIGGVLYIRRAMRKSEDGE